MSRTFKREKLSPRTPLKLEDKRTGWVGEQCYSQEGKAFIKTLEHRHNRRVAKRMEKEIE